MKNKVYQRTREFNPCDIKLTKKIEYKKNTLIIFLNYTHAIHGVTIREKNDKSRRLINLTAKTFFNSRDDLIKNRAPGWDNIITQDGN